MKTKIGMLGILATSIGIVAVAVASTATPARAQAPATSPSSGPGARAAVQRFDARWTPYLGCWRLLHENVRVEGAAAPAAAMPPGPTITVCVQPSGATTGVTMTTFAEGKQILEQTVVADAAPRTVAESGCNGTERSEWSSDGLRLFTRVDLACNDRPAQSISGLTLVAKGPAWIDIQAAPGDQQQVRIRRYVRTSDRPEGLAALSPEMITRATVDGLTASSHRLSQGDIEEASRKAPSQVVEAAIIETEARFALDSRTLKQLADAGVSPNVIDLMVAQSFPSHFRVERPITLPPSPGAASAGVSVTAGSAQYPTQYPYATQYPGQYAPYAYYPYGAYDPFYYYSYYYSPFAYPYYWGAGTFYRGPTYYITNGGTIVVPNGSGSGSGGGANSDNGHGQLINGLGYTRVHPASPGDSAQPATATQHAATATKTVRGASGSDAASSSSSGSSGSSGSSSGASASGGSSSGSSSGSAGGGRTAQPR